MSFDVVAGDFSVHIQLEVTLESRGQPLETVAGHFDDVLVLNLVIRSSEQGSSEMGVVRLAVFGSAKPVGSDLVGTCVLEGSEGGDDDPAVAVSFAQFDDGVFVARVGSAARGGGAAV
ncbi:MAG: hypothetical protein JRF33_14690 [Deltaproteobacteria bacterium]|nr:hypothetical protein [Deltaproteobacteria bacterium]